MKGRPWPAGSLQEPSRLGRRTARASTHIQPIGHPLLLLARNHDARERRLVLKRFDARTWRRETQSIPPRVHGARDFCRPLARVAHTLPFFHMTTTAVGLKGDHWPACARPGREGGGGRDSWMEPDDRRERVPPLRTGRICIPSRRGPGGRVASTNPSVQSPLPPFYPFTRETTDREAAAGLTPL